ncbi:hypothetical protein MNBD_ALPHA03-1199 [hydrothermal vent metagenome]|uniref:Uncharacterized protein n=1 Tax=hydrothermal vent metagenome TaxID=652676 RepID=A0A3B1B3D5_9ZZZZ
MNSKQLLQLTMWCFLIVCLGSFAISLNGFDTILNAEQVSFVNSALALVIASISSVLIYVGWQWLFYCVELCNTKRSLSAVMLIGVAMLGCIYGVSSIPGVVGMAGDKPLNIHIDHTFMLWEGDFEQLQLYQKSIVSFKHELAIERDRYHQRGQDEFDTGVQTGTRGAGAVSSGQIAIGKQLSALITQLETATFELDEQIKSGQRVLDKARKAVAKIKSPKIKMEKIAPYADQLRTILVSIKSRDLSGMIERVINFLPREIDSRIQWAKGAELRERQKLVIAAIRDELDATAEQVNTHLEKLDELKLKQVHEFERLTAMEASFSYFSSLRTIWATSLIIDSFGYLVLCLLLIKTHFLSKEDIHEFEVNNTTSKDIRIAKDAEGFSNRMGPPHHFLSRMDDHHYGMKNKKDEEENKDNE